MHLLKTIPSMQPVSDSNTIATAYGCAESISTDNTSLQEITETRIALESILLKSSIKNATDVHLVALEENIERCSSAKADIKEEKAPPILANFHILLAEPSENIILKTFLQSLVGLTNRFIHMNTPGLPLSDHHLSEHEEILINFKNRKFKQTKAALQHHLLSSARQIDTALNNKMG